MAVRVLCTGDVHIGRTSSKVTGEYSCADVWTSIVNKALEEQVDLLAISGDIVDGTNKSYESIGPLEDGLQRLNAAGIETVAVAGNHDYDVLRRLTGSLGTERFHLLGMNGTWERYTLQREGVAVLHVDGWSFQREHVRENPMRDFLDHPADDTPVLGLLHADLGMPRSIYGPVVIEELQARRVDLWLLGHIHAPRQIRHVDGTVVMYPGSPLAMDPGELGVHGIWMAEFEHGHDVRLTSIPISPVRYVVEIIDAASITDEETFMATITAALRDVGQRARSECDDTSLGVVSARIALTGTSTAHHSIPSWWEQARAQLRSFPAGGPITIEIDEFTSAVRPPIVLEDQARRNDPVGETARLLLALEAPELIPPYDDLVRQTTDDLVRIHAHPGYATLAAREQQAGEETPGERDAIVHLKSQGWRMLSELIAMKADA